MEFLPAAPRRGLFLNYCFEDAVHEMPSASLRVTDQARIELAFVASVVARHCCRCRWRMLSSELAVVVCADRLATRLVARQRVTSLLIRPFCT